MSDRGYQERARQQNPAGYENPKQNLVYYHQPQTTKQQQPPAPKQPQPQAAKQPQPQAMKQPQPQAAKQPQPQAMKQPQPQAMKQPQPQAAKQPQPQAMKQPQPQAMKQPQPQAAKQPQPQAMKQPQPQAMKQPQPQAMKQPQPQAMKQPQPQAMKQPQPQAMKQPQPQAMKQPQPQAAKQPQPQPMNQQNASVSHVSAHAQNNNDTIVPLSSVYNDPNSDARDGSTPFAASSFSDKRIRQAFIQKVYLILTAMLLVTVVFICIFLFVEPVKQWVLAHWWLSLVAFAVYFTVYLVLVCCDSVRRAYPTNYICLIIFNLAFSWACATVSSYYSTEIVLAAVGITALVCVSISIFAIQTKIDFTLCTGLLFVLAMVVMIFGIAVTIVFFVAGRNYILTCVYGALAALVMGLCLAYETQLIIGGRRYQLSPEEYIYGALQLYMDVGTLYMIILSFFSYSK